MHHSRSGMQTNSTIGRILICNDINNPNKKELALLWRIKHIYEMICRFLEGGHKYEN